MGKNKESKDPSQIQASKQRIEAKRAEAGEQMVKD
jgi:hypothetical protein